MTVYSFRNFVFEPETGKLLAGGVPVPLGVTESRLLHTLLEKPGSVLRKDELISSVWGRAIVSDNALHVHIAGLRKLLGDDAVFTKRGVGYRFALEVSCHSSRSILGNLVHGEPRGVADSTFLIGRERELREISSLLRTARLMTLMGAGGVGKTSLAVHVAAAQGDHFPDGVWLVELSPLRDTALIPHQIAAALGLGLGKTANPLQTLVRQLSTKNALLILDNCEHVVRACGEICEVLLSRAPKLRILNTSRESLSCAGEIIFPVEPLVLPPDGSSPPLIRAAPAVELFVARAKASVPGLRIADDELPIAARICRRLDGLPLALEMVAAWAGILGLPALEKKLEGSLQSWLRARSTAPQRQSNLAATLRWSYDLLSSAEQVVLARLSAFAGPFTIEAAEAVAGYGSIPGAQVFEHVASLVRKSMLALASGASPPEFRLLETTRAFAAEQLADSPDAQETRRRYASHVLRCLTAAAEEWERLSDALWRKRYAPLLPDLRAALDWAIAQDSRVAVALAGVGWPLWREMSLHTEGRQRLNAAIALITPDTPPVLAARSLRGLSELSLNTDAVSVAYDKLLEAVSLYRQESVSPELGATLLDVAYAAQALGRIDEARRYHSEAMALLEGTDRHRTIAHAHCVQATIEISAGDLQAAEAASSIAIRLSEAAGADRTALVVSANLLEARLVEEDFQAAVEGGIRLCERLRSSPYADVLGFALGLLTIAFVFTGEEEKALIAAREAAAILREENMMFWMYDYLALRLAKKERYTDAAVLLGYANHLFARSGWLREPTALRAVRMALELLRPAMGAAELEQLIASGGHLSEERAVALALNS